MINRQEIFCSTEQTQSYLGFSHGPTLPFASAFHITKTMPVISKQVAPTEFFIYDDKNSSLIPINPYAVQFDARSGMVVPPDGFTAIYTPVPQLTGSVSCSSSDSGSHSPEPVTKLSQRKFPHRSKQKRIEEVYNSIADYFSKLNVYAESEKDILRGNDTCRIHVKTFQSLNKILEVLKQCYHHREVQIVKLATPISMKNKYQKKGFIVYMQLSKSNQVPTVQGIFSKYSKWFKKCDVAEKLDRKINAHVTLPAGATKDGRTVTLSSLTMKPMTKKVTYGA